MYFKLHPLSRFIGQPVNAAQVRAVVRSQIFKEAAVLHNPEPTIDVRCAADNSVYIDIRYADAATGQTQVLGFTLGART